MIKKLKESAMSELDILAQESSDFNAFVKAVKQDFPQLANDLTNPEVIEFLKNIYEDADNLREGYPILLKNLIKK